MVIKKPRTILEFDEVELFETSAVGIPSYSYAHKSFAKSLKDLFHGEGGGELNLKELQNMNEEEIAAAKAAKAAEEAEAEAKAKADAEAAAKADADGEGDGDGDGDGDGEGDGDDAGKSVGLKDMTKIMAKAVSDGISNGMKAIETDRGLADTKTPAEKQAELMKDASNGQVFAAAFNMGGIQ